MNRLENLALGIEDRIVDRLFALVKGESVKKTVHYLIKKEEVEIKDDKREEEEENVNEKETDDIFIENKRENKKNKRLSGQFSLDWEKEKAEVIDSIKPRTFVQNLNYIFQFAVESKRSKATYIEQSNNVFGKKDLVGYKFVSH